MILKLNFKIPEIYLVYNCYFPNPYHIGVKALDVCHDHWQYQKVIFILLKQSYYGENTGTVHKFLRRMAQYPPPPM